MLSAHHSADVRSANFILGVQHQHGEAAYPGGLLCTRRERPCRRAANSRGEFTPSHAARSTSKGRNAIQNIARGDMAVRGFEDAIYN